MNTKNSITFKLNDKREVEPIDLLDWDQYMADSLNERQVGLDRIGPVVISTMFIGLNLNIGTTKPLYFETRVRIPASGDFIKRYSTWTEAEEGHKLATGETLAVIAKFKP